MTTEKQDSVYLARQLENFIPEKVWLEYPGLKCRDLAPINSKIKGDHFTSFKYKVYGQTALAKIIGAKATDIPKLNVYAEEFEGKVFPMAIGNEWTYQEIAVASKNGDDIVGDTAKIARESHLFLENTVFFNGDSDYGLYGLTTHPNIAQSAVAVGASSGNTTWDGGSPKTAAEIMFDVQDLIDEVEVATKGLHKANTVVFPLSAKSQLNQPYSTLSSKTVLAALKENNPDVKVWEFCNDLETSGTGASRVMFAYKMDPSVLSIVVPYETKANPLVTKINGQEVAFVMGIGGIWCDKPLAIQGAYGF